MTTMRSIVAAAVAVLAAGCGDEARNPAAQLAATDDLLRGDEGCNGLPVAPESLRVDLYEPPFSNPTDVTNPLFPIGALQRVVLLGSVEGEPLRVETTLLAEPRTIDLGDRKVQTLVSQYVAWIDGRIHEVALDWYAQDDHGAVWYFGEDVFNYEDGRIADTEGTWLAGRDGPVAMIMPADPQPGDVWRPENICGLVFEEVALIETGVTVEGPRGPIAGAIVTEELHMDGVLENKTFAPGYGEFVTGDPDGDLEAVAIAVPIDAVPGPAPDEVETLSDGAEEIFRLARSRRWGRVSAEVEEMNDAWEALRSGGLPPLLEARMNGALDELGEAVEARDRAATRQASILVALAGLDFELRHEERAEIDRDLIEVWLRQLALDAQAHDRGGVRSDLASIRWIRDRLRHGDCRGIDAGLRALEAAADAGDYVGLEGGAESLRGELVSARPRGQVRR
jgi:hypothetical protein